MLIDIWDGISREETLNLWRSQAAWGAALWPDPTAVEDYVQGCNWYYADWPYLDDPDRNRAMMGNVRKLHARFKQSAVM